MTVDGGLSSGVVLAGGYRIGPQIGAGGMGVVYRAHDQRLNRVVAIKMLREGAADRRFREEGRLLAELSHPGLVSILDEGEHEGHPFLVLQYVPGPTLRELLEIGPMLPDEVTRTGACLASALAYVHEHGIVHRDIKPSNILVTGDGTPVLNDFGISYRQGRTRWTATGFVNGTAAYLAPEQVRGEIPGTGIDVYALGLVLLECLSGEPEYGGSAIESAVARLHRSPQRPEGIPQWLADVLMAMTATDPAARPDARYAADLLSGIRRLDAPRLTGRTRRTKMRMALLAGTATVAAAGLAIALLLPGTQASGNADQPGVPVVAPPTTGKAPVTSSAKVPATKTTPVTKAGTPTAHVSPAVAARPVAQPKGNPGHGKGKGHDKGGGKGKG